MPDYSKGKIYKIVNTKNDKVYIGSTTQLLCNRMSCHRSLAIRLNSQCGKLYKAMRFHGVKNFAIVLVKDYPCESKKQLEDQEFKIIKKYLANGDALYNTTIVKGKFADSTKRRMSKANTGSGATHPRFNRGSIRRVTERGLSRWSFRWQEDGNTRSKTFSEIKYGKDEAERLVKEYQNKIYPID